MANEPTNPNGEVSHDLVYFIDLPIKPSKWDAFSPNLFWALGDLAHSLAEFGIGRVTDQSVRVEQ
jgi:hypothetical protein